MGKNTPVPIRFDAEVRRELESLGQASGLSISDLCRLAVEKFLDEVAITGQVRLQVDQRPSQRAQLRPVHTPDPRRLQPENLDGEEQKSSSLNLAVTSEESAFKETRQTNSLSLLGSALEEPDFPL